MPNRAPLRSVFQFPGSGSPMLRNWNRSATRPAFASAAASFLVNFGVFGENMARVRDALLNVYGFEPDQIEFFSFFAEPIPGFEDDAIEVIATGLREGACPRDVRRSARLLQAYELDFWEAASEAPGSPLPVSWPAN